MSRRRRCQSCGMPLDKDPHGGGTNEDHSKSQEFCGFCYQNGAFLDPQLTLKEMQQRVGQLTKKMFIKKKLPFASLLAWWQIRRIRHLRRWQQK